MDSTLLDTQRMASEALVDFPRPDEMATELLGEWLLTQGVTHSPCDIDVVTVHYQYEPLGEGRNQFRENAIVRQKMDLVAALLSNWQGETASGYGGFHYGDWAGIAPSGPLHMTERLAPGTLFWNAEPFQVFNGLYRRTTPAHYGPDTLLPVRAEAFQAFIWNLRFHHLFRERLHTYWQRQAAAYQRALKIALLAACNKQVIEGSLSAPAQALVWKAAGVMPTADQVRLSMLNVYGYSSVSILRMTDLQRNLNVLYIPGNASPLHTFDTPQAMKHWFATQCQTRERRKRLLHHFKRADWPDGLDFSGLRTALTGLGLFPEPHRLDTNAPGFATSGRWDPDEIIDYRPERYSPAITGDLFAHLMHLERQRSYADTDSQIVSNHQIDREHWGNYLQIGLNVLLPFAVVIPPIAPLLAVAGVAQFGLGLQQAIDGRSLAAKADGVQQQVFGLFNALPLAAQAFTRIPRVFAYRSPGFKTWAELRAQVVREGSLEEGLELTDLAPASLAFRPSTLYEGVAHASHCTRVEWDLFPRFYAHFDLGTTRIEEAVDLELSSNAFIKSREVGTPDAQRWIAHLEQPDILTPLVDERQVDDAARMVTLRSLGLYLDLPVSTAPFEALDITPIPKRVSSLWVGNRILGEPFLGTLAHNARALRDSDYTFELHLSQRSPQAFARNRSLLAEHAPELSVRVLEEQPFYQAFTESPVFPQFQAALGTMGNFSSACDILRVQLLKRLGGLYLDADDRLVLTAASGRPRAKLTGMTLRTPPDGLLLAPPVCNDQLGLYFKFNTSMIGSHPDNPTLDAMLETMHARYAENATFYDSHPDADVDPVAFDDYARRLSRLTGPALMNEVIDARLPWLRQLRELCVLLVSPVTDTHQIINLRWFNRMLDTHLPLDRIAQVGSANSWRTTR
ncbi:mannosyltransferase [Pseudomonas entomophila]|uniref:dermonecrotic toxin domain-containing protein n=1 Tax=Pseudomonas entomophila TaxID=312306 RepID=UPI0015E3E2D7|nr:DUF6543 domain-containing protein [Pseudomonas entomophila]MBA1187875.1 mannosyltransferase [Pseudomonas entomophila]